MGLDFLVGKTVEQMFITPDGSHLKFVCKKGTYYAAAIGDCCSKSWIDGVYGYILSGKVEKIEHVDLASYCPRECDDPNIKVYSIRIFWESGFDCAIEFRNESNGYYGGRLEQCEALPSDTEWKELKE